MRTFPSRNKHIPYLRVYLRRTEREFVAESSATATVTATVTASLYCSYSFERIWKLSRVTNTNYDRMGQYLMFSPNGDRMYVDQSYVSYFYYRDGSLSNTSSYIWYSSVSTNINYYTPSLSHTSSILWYPFPAFSGDGRKFVSGGQYVPLADSTLSATPSWQRQTDAGLRVYCDEGSRTWTVTTIPYPYAIPVDHIAPVYHIEPFMDYSGSSIVLFSYLANPGYTWDFYDTHPYLPYEFKLTTYIPDSVTYSWTLATETTLNYRSFYPNDWPTQSANGSLSWSAIITPVHRGSFAGLGCSYPNNKFGIWVRTGAANGFPNEVTPSSRPSFMQFFEKAGNSGTYAVDSSHPVLNFRVVGNNSYFGSKVTLSCDSQDKAYIFAGEESRTVSQYGQLGIMNYFECISGSWTHSIIHCPSGFEATDGAFGKYWAINGDSTRMVIGQTGWPGKGSPHYAHLVHVYHKENGYWKYITTQTVSYSTAAAPFTAIYHSPTREQWILAATSETTLGNTNNGVLYLGNYSIVCN